MDEQTRKTDQLKTFNEIGKALASSLDLDEILKVVVEKINTLLDHDNWSLILLDEESARLRFEIIVGERAEALKDFSMDSGEGIAGWVAVNGEPLLVTDAANDPRFSGRADRASSFSTGSVLCVPLKTKGRPLGVIEIVSKEKDDKFCREDLLFLTTLADYTAIAIENAHLFKKVQELSVTDDLTHLSNSRYMHNFLDREMERASRYETDISMVFMDLDYFKNINDDHGHICGSKLLSEVAAVIKGAIRSVDIACRYGGDEFVILMPETTKENALGVAKRVQKAIRETVFLKAEGVNCHITASIGVASFPEDAKDKLDLIHLADKAMYRVKNRSRNGIEVA